MYIQIISFLILRFKASYKILEARTKSKKRQKLLVEFMKRDILQCRWVYKMMELGKKNIWYYYWKIWSSKLSLNGWMMLFHFAQLQIDESRTISLRHPDSNILNFTPSLIQVSSIKQKVRYRVYNLLLRCLVFSISSKMYKFLKS